MVKEDRYKLDINNPEVKRDLEEALKIARDFSKKFYDARIIPYELLIQPMTI